MGTVDEVRERLPIEELVGAVVALKRAGSTYKGLCPFHTEKTPSFVVSPSRGRYHCFGCGQDGDIFNFVMATQNLDFPGALRVLAAKAGIEVEDPREARSGGSVETRIYEMNAAAATYFQSVLAGRAGARAREYLQRRKIVAATVERFGLGYSPDGRDALCARLRESGYSDADLVAAGLALSSDEGAPLRDRWRGRLIFPIRDVKGRITGFGGRIIGDGEPKYLNSPATAVFDKSRVLYTIEHAGDAIRAAREAVVVEGYVDALRAHQEGFANVVATLGTAITANQLRTLGRLAPRVVLSLDADTAGQKASMRACLAALAALVRSMPSDRRRELRPPQALVATLPDGQDPDDLIAANPDAWRQAVSAAVPLMDHYFALVEAGLDRAAPEWRQEAIDTLAPAIGQLDSLGLQQTYIERLADLTSVDVRYLRDITPGDLVVTRPRGPAPRRRDESSRPNETPADPVRVTEEYVIGLLLLNRPLTPELRAELASHMPQTIDLAPLFRVLAEGLEVSNEDELADRLASAAAERPPVRPERLVREVRTCLARIDDQRLRRELRTIGQVVAEVDRDTAREMDGRVLETLTLKGLMTARLHDEQALQRREPAVTPGYDGTGGG